MKKMKLAVMTAIAAALCIFFSAQAFAANNFYILPNSDSRYLTASDLNGLSKDQLRLARNEIYARHGRLFDSPDIQNYFNSQIWYNGRIRPDNFSESVLNQYEKANISFIQKIEDNAPQNNTPQPPSPAAYILPESDTRYLTENELRGMTADTLRLARNEIYARHGRLFESQDLQIYFNAQPWYNGRVQPANFNENVLNQYEKANIALLQRLEGGGSPPAGGGSPPKGGGSPSASRVELRITMNQLGYLINGQPARFDVPPYLDSRANRSMIPMRFIAEAFGAAVTWDDYTATQTIMLNGRTFRLTQNVPLPGGMGTPVLVRDRFFVPLRYVSEELGASVDWDDATQTNIIVYYR